MASFRTLYTEFEHTKNLCQFCQNFAPDSEATRFLLIRSLDKPHLKDVIRQYGGTSASDNFLPLMEGAYHSSVTIPQLLDYIESKRTELVRLREQELEGLPSVLEHFPIVACGVRNDSVDDIIKKFVRDKSLKTLTELETELDQAVLPRVRQYSLWSYYNQTANDIIELAFLRHPRVIPTLRKIPNIDFFLNIGGEITPFDLKFTHISDDYFDLAAQGISRNTDPAAGDDFQVTGPDANSELKQIKAFYTAFKRRHRQLGLPNISDLPGKTIKEEILTRLAACGDPAAAQFAADALQRRRELVPTDPESLRSLEWWNYKYQGERLFCNNNRIFLFLAYTDRFVDGRELKGRTAQISALVTRLLDGVNAESIHTVRYRYTKDAGLTGSYQALSLSAIYYE